MLSIIVNVSKNNVIGCANGMVFDIKEDLKRFRQITLGKTVIMGRKTFESLPFILPKRHSVILTQNRDYKIPDTEENVTIIYDFDEIITHYKNLDEEVFIIGGGTLYKETILYCDKLYVTHVDKEALGDTYFPPISDDFVVDYMSEDIYSESEKCYYKYINYKRK